MPVKRIRCIYKKTLSIMIILIFLFTPFNVVLAGGGSGGNNYYGWGRDYFNQMGRDQTSQNSFNYAVQPLDDSIGGEFSSATIKKVSAGISSVLALDENGSVWAWGLNMYGNLGVGTYNDRYNRPYMIPTEFFQVDAVTRTIEDISTNERFSLALDNEGDVWVWGYNRNHEISQGSSSFCEEVPLRIVFFDDKPVTAIAAGNSHGLALVDGNVYEWGNGSQGQLVNSTSTLTEPAKIPYFNDKTIIDIATNIALSWGDQFSLALADDGKVYAWGSNRFGQLGIGNRDAQSGVVEVDFPVDVEIASISAGYQHNLASDKNGNVWSWGRNYQGSMGIGNLSFGSEVPVAVEGLSGVVKVSGGYGHSLALKYDGTIFGWGSNFYGEMGNEDSGWGKRETQPIRVGKIQGGSYLEGIGDISAGRDFSVVIEGAIDGNYEFESTFDLSLEVPGAKIIGTPFNLVIEQLSGPDGQIVGDGSYTVQVTSDIDGLCGGGESVSFVNGGNTGQVYATLTSIGQHILTVNVIDSEGSFSPAEQKITVEVIEPPLVRITDNDLDKVYFDGDDFEITLQHPEFTSAGSITVELGILPEDDSGYASYEIINGLDVDNGSYTKTVLINGNGEFVISGTIQSALEPGIIAIKILSPGDIAGISNTAIPVERDGQFEKPEEEACFGIVGVKVPDAIDIIVDPELSGFDNLYSLEGTIAFKKVGLGKIEFAPGLDIINYRDELIELGNAISLQNDNGEFKVSIDTSTLAFLEGLDASISLENPKAFFDENELTQENIHELLEVGVLDNGQDIDGEDLFEYLFVDKDGNFDLRLLQDGNEYLEMPVNHFTQYTIKKVSTYEISLDADAPTVFGAEVEGYNPAPSETITVTKAGSGDITNLAVALSGTNQSDFELGALGATTLTEGSPSTTFTVSPKTGLEPDSYAATVTVTADNDISEYFDVVFEVEPLIVTTVEVSGVNIIIIPNSGTETESYTAVVKDQYNNPMTEESVNWNLINPENIVGIELTSTGGLTESLNVTDATTEGAVKVKVTSDSDPEKTDQIEVKLVDSTNAYLSNLTLSSGTLSPSFDRETESYSVSVSNSVSNITVTPTADAGENATITVNETEVNSGEASDSISLSVGDNTINIEVTAEDNETTKEYTITVNRDSAPTGGGGGGGGRRTPDPDDDDEEDEEADDEELVEDPDVGKARQTKEDSVSSDGGTISTEDGSVELEVPEGAISEEERTIKITVFEVDSESTLAKADSITEGRMDMVSDVIEMTSENRNFERPVTARFRYNKEKVTDSRNLRVFYWNENTNRWIPIPIESTRINEEDGTVEADLNHFTRFTVMEVKERLDFKDVSEEWFASYVDRLILLDVTEGYIEDGERSFKPERTVTRGEFAVFLQRALNLEVGEDELRFNDTNRIPEWAIDSVQAAVEKGIIAGYDDNTFRADREINRAEMAVMIIRALGLEASDKELVFDDTSEIPQWAKGHIAKAVEKGIIGGRPDNTFDPLGNALRSETAKMIVEMIEAYR